jgi:hypothetical protein
LEQYEPTEYEVGVAQREDTNHRSQVLFETYSRLNREEVSGGNTPEEMDAPLEPGSEKKPKLRRRFSQGPMPKPSPRLNLIPEE